MAEGISSPTVALKDYNREIELSGAKKAPLKMDKWRSTSIDLYYCGYVEMHKAVEASNPHGLHEKLITKEQHDKIVIAFNGKPKNQAGPNAAGNPLYPFNNMVCHTDCPLSKSRYNRFVGVTVKNGRGKQYAKYKCRGCNMYIDRSVMHAKIGQEISKWQLTESGKKALDTALEEVFNLEQGDIAEALKELHSKKKLKMKQAEEYMQAYVHEPAGPMKEHIKSEYDSVVGLIRKYDDEIDQIGDLDARELELFGRYALDFIGDLAQHVLELTPQNARLCKQLLFPSGFFVDDFENVYTPTFSPIYRLIETKNDSFESESSLMVLHKGKCLHKNGDTPVPKELEQTRLNTKTIIEEVERWRVILSTNYANYRLECGLPA